MSQGFHTYGVLWEEELVIWYVDGQEVQRITGPRVSDEPMNIIAQLVVGSEWIGAPTAASIPAVFEKRSETFPERCPALRTDR